MPEKLDVYEAGVELCYAAATTLLIRTARDIALKSSCLSGEQSAAETTFTLYDEANHYGLYISPVAGHVKVEAAPGFEVLPTSSLSKTATTFTWPLGSESMKPMREV